MAAYKPGDTLLIKNPREWDERRHLFIIISDPSNHPQRVMLLPCIETLKEYHRDRSCILQPGDHPFVRQPSIVNYRDCVELSDAALDELVGTGDAKRREALTAEVLQRVLTGARKTPNLDARQKAMLPPDQPHSAG